MCVCLWESFLYDIFESMFSIQIRFSAGIFHYFRFKIKMLKDMFAQGNRLNFRFVRDWINFQLFIEFPLKVCVCAVRHSNHSHSGNKAALCCCFCCYCESVQMQMHLHIKDKHWFGHIECDHRMREKWSVYFKWRKTRALNL